MRGRRAVKNLLGPASREVQRALSHLKDGKEWREFYCAAPGLDMKARVHVGPDNPQAYQDGDYSSEVTSRSHGRLQ